MDELNKPIEEETITPEEETVVEEIAKTEKKKLTQLEKALIVVVVVLLTFCCILAAGKPKSKIMLSELNEVFVDTNASIKLQNGWYHTDSGEFLAYEDGLLKLKGAIEFTEAEENDAVSYMLNLAASYGATLMNTGSYDCYTITTDYNDESYFYYFFYENGVFAQLTLIGVEEKEATKIVETLTFE